MASTTSDTPAFFKAWMRQLGSDLWFDNISAGSKVLLLSALCTSIWCMIMGLFAKSMMGFGTVRVSGRSLVPYPPTRMSAFMVWLQEQREKSQGGLDGRHFARPVETTYSWNDHLTRSCKSNPALRHKCRESLPSRSRSHQNPRKAARVIVRAKRYQSSCRNKLTLDCNHGSNLRLEFYRPAGNVLQASQRPEPVPWAAATARQLASQPKYAPRGALNPPQQRGFSRILKVP